ncbi:Ig-like domain-containing protein [Kordiimonas lacus]|uniref:Ig-like domain-containing protein n=3 Tax=Kordiimonas TaxID=288021 RepID=UPI002FD94022
MPTVSLTNEANVTDNGTLMLDKAVAVKMVEVGGTSYLLAMGTLEGISVFEANADGSLTNVFNVADSGPFQLSGGRDLAVADVGGTTYVFAAGSIDDGVSVFSMGTDGSLTNVANIADSGTVNLNGAQSLATAVVGGTTYLTVAGADDNGISVFSVATDGTLTHTGNADDDGTLALADVRSLETITVGSNSYVIGAGYDDNGISAFKINSDGTLTHTETISDSGSMNLTGASAITTATVNGTGYVFVGSSTDNGISVFSIDSNGNLANVANTGSSVLSAIKGMDVFEYNGQTYLAASGSSSNTVKLYEVANDGSLTQAYSLSDNGTINLNNVWGIDAASVGGEQHLYVSAFSDSGISSFDLNTAPEIALSPTNVAYTEGALPITTSGTSLVSDADGNEWNGGTLTAQLDGSAGISDVLSFSDTDGSSVTITVSGTNILANGVDIGDISHSGGTVSGTDVLEITFNGNATEGIVREVVQSLAYQNTSDDPTSGQETATREITVTVADNAGAASSASGTILVVPANDDPSMSDLPTSIDVTEDVASNIDLSAATFSDPDSGSNVITLSLAVEAGTLAASDTGGVTVADSGTAQITLTGTVSNLDTYLNTSSSIQYTSAENDDTSTTLTIVANDGGNTGYGGGTDVVVGTTTLNIAAINDDPTATGVDDVFVSGAEGQSISVDMSGVVLADVDANGAELTLSFDVLGEGGLTLSDGADVTVSGSSVTGTIDNLQSYLATPSNIQYLNNGEDSGDTIRVYLNDNGNTGTGGGTAVEVGLIDVTLSPTNDDPVVTGLPADLDVTEDEVSDLDLSPIAITDVDAGAQDITLTLTVDSGVLIAGDSGGVIVGDTDTAQITLTGSASELNAYLNESGSVQYQSAENDDTSATLTVVINDGGNTGAGGGQDILVGTTTLNIAAINDDPTATGVDDVFVSGAEGQSISVDMSGVVLADVDANGAELTLSFDVLGEGGLTLSDGADVTVSGSSVTGTIDNLQSYLATPSNIQYLNNGEDSGDTIRVYLNDNGNTGTGGGTAVEVGLIDVTLSPTNDDPVVTGLPADLDVTEDEVSDLDLSPIAITDVDAGAQDITLTLTVDSGVLIAGDSGGVIVGDTDTAQITLTGSASELNAYLNESGSVQYQSAENDDTSATLTVVINDGGNTGAGGGQDILVGTTTLNIAAINDAPTMDGLDSVTVEAIEGTPSNVDMSGVTISDVDANGGEITLWLDPGEGQLIVAEGAGVTLGSGDGAHSVTGTIPALTSYLSSPENIQYLNETGEDATDGILVYLSDNGNTGTGGGTPNLIGSIELAVTQVNDDPVMTALPATINVTEDVASNIDLSAATLSDVDAGSNPITLTLNVDSGTLAASDVAGVTVADSGTAQITLTGTVSDLDEYLNTASNIQYTGAENDDTSATLTIGANDGGNVGTGGGQDVTLGTIAINIDGVNDMPTLLGLPEAPITTDEGVLVNIDLSDAVLADVDAGDGEVSVYLLPSANGEIFLAEGTGVTVQVGDGFGEITGTVDDINTYLSDPANIQYLNDSERDVSDTISISVNDHGNSGSGGGVAFSMGSIVVNVLAVNDDPVAVDMPTSISVTEDIASDVDFSGMTISDDAGVDDNITITLNVDAGTLDAVDANGVTVSNGGTDTIILTGTVSNLNGYMGTASNIQYTSAENDDTSATLTIIANDGGSLGQGGGGNVTLGTVELSIDPTNDAPTSTDATLTFGENSDFTLNQSHFGFEDVDSGDALEAVRIDTLPASGTLQLDGAGVTAGDVITVADIDAGLLTYSPPADTTGQAVASFTFTVNDGDTFAEASSTITFDGEPNTAPTLSLADTTIDHVEGAGASHLDAAAILEDADGDSDFQGATLTVQVTGQADADDQLFLSDDNGTGPVITVSGTDVLADGVDVGDVNMDGGLATGDAQLVINFDEDATQEIVQEVARAFVYETTSDTPSGDAKTVTVTLADAHTAMATDSVQVSITETNDDPVAAGLPAILGVKEDTQSEVDLSGITLADDAGENPIVLTLSVASGILDVTGESGPITVSGEGTSTITLEGTVEALNSYISDATRFVYLGAENDDTSTTLTLLANDGGNSGTGGGENVTLGTIALEIGAVNDAPTGADNQLTFTEDTNFTLQASHFGFADVDGDTLQTVRIASLPDSGTLTLDGTPVSGSDDIAVADIQAGLLRYQPEAGVTGDDVASFTFYVGDGKDLSDQENTITFDGQEASSGGGSGSGGSSGGGSTPDPEPIDQNLGDNGGTAVGSDLADTILGGAGDDTVSGGAGDDILPGGDGSDVISGGTGNDVLYAGAGDTGNDTLDGGEGADTVGGGAGDDVLSGGSGNDMVFAGLGNDVVAGGDGADLVFGGMGDDLIGGGDGSDMLFNGGGADTVDGGAGDDEIWAGAGDDLLTGGAGADTFMFGANSGNDTITDFSTADDLLDLRFTVTDFADASAVQAAASDATQSGVDGLLIDLGGGQSVFLQGLSMADFASLDITL